jgi:hypothetical protein
MIDDLFNPNRNLCLCREGFSEKGIPCAMRVGCLQVGRHPRPIVDKWGGWDPVKAAEEGKRLFPDGKD